MKRAQRAFTILALTAVAIYPSIPSALAEAPIYMGAKFCRTCHSSADKDRYHRWLESRHANTFDALKGAEMTDSRCLSCHMTGYDQAIS